MTDKNVFLIAAGLKFIESADMREYLQTTNAPMSLWRWCHAIAAARATLEEKAAALRTLAEQYPLEELSEGELSFYQPDTADFCDPRKMADAAFLALHEAQNAPSGSVFMLTRHNRSLPWALADHWRFEYGYNVRKDTEIFSSFAQAMEYIAEDCNDEDAELSGNDAQIWDYDMYWNEIDRYDLNTEGKLEISYTWYVGESGVIWGFDLEHERHYLSDGCDMFSPWEEMNLPLPFQRGDIITHDCRPYYGEFHCLVLNNLYPGDCCSSYCAFMCDYGRLNTGAFHHLPHCQIQRFSPSLRAARFEGKLPKREAPLRVLGEKIRDSPELADAVEKFINYARGRRRRNRNSDAAPRIGAAWKDIQAEFGWR